jgi:hypothetical protein
VFIDDGGHFRANAASAAKAPSSIMAKFCGPTASPLQVQQMAAPDLIETSVTYVRANGQTLQVTDTTANQGTASAPTSLTRYYFSVSGSKDGTALLLTGSRTVPPLAVGASSQGTTTVAIPSAASAGTYFLLACADDLNVVPELNENNNCTASSIRVVYLPDLIESAVGSSSQPSGTGLALKISDTTINQGGTAAGASVTQYYLSPLISKFATGARLLNGNRAVPSLSAGASSTGTTTATIPPDIITGTYYLLACANDTNLFPETDQTNNCAAAASRLAVGPDLVETGVGSQNLISGAGATMVVQDTASNQGAGNAGSSVTQYYLSPLISKAAIGARLLSGSRGVLPLAPGGISTGSTSVTVPSDMATGNYYLLACANDTNLVAETNTTNNCSAASARIQVGPDLVESGVSSQTVIASVGATFTVWDTTSNQGGGSAAASITQYYFSPLISKYASGARLLTGSRAVPSLSAGATSNGGTSVTVPSSVAAGTYYLLACADDTNLVTETNENNNCAAASTRIQVTAQ